MHCFGYGCWVFPLVFLVVMVVLSFGFARRGRRSWCFGPRRRSGDKERITKLEEEIRTLKDQRTESSLLK